MHSTTLLVLCTLWVVVRASLAGQGRSSLNNANVHVEAPRSGRPCVDDLLCAATIDHRKATPDDREEGESDIFEFSQPTKLTISASSPENLHNRGRQRRQSSGLDILHEYQKMIKAHAWLFGLSFLVILPLGALVARLSRTWNPFWFKAHWILQFYIAGPLILAAFILAILAVKKHRTGHFNDMHKKTGLALFILYCVQVSFGAFIHFVKNPKRSRRPPQNYLHAVLGLAILGLALYQVHIGYKTEWPLFVAVGFAPSGVNTVWIIWAVAIPVLYTAGLILLPRQFRQERLAAKEQPVQLEERPLTTQQA